MPMRTNWWQRFFDADYYKVWGGFVSDARSDEESAAIWELLGLGPASRVLDAPCGYGRISRRLAARGAEVLGVDQSEALLDEAERALGDLAPARLRYVRHDLRDPLAPTEIGDGFDV